MVEDNKYGVDPYKRVQSEDRNNAYHISITVDEKDEQTALKELRRILEEMEQKGATGDCSEHGDTYMPYYWWTAYPFVHKGG